jgi:hypothetical protein
MSPDVRAAVRLLGVYTAGRFDIWVLAGPARASCRAHVASVLAGHKVPQSKAGVNALRDAFYLHAQPAGDCMAAREDAFRNWARSTDEAQS